MATWTALYIRQNNLPAVSQNLRQITGFAHQRAATSVEAEGILHRFAGEEPTTLAYAIVQPGWVIALHNGYGAVEELALGISQELDTDVLSVRAQSVSSFFYFAWYKCGRKMREIEQCHSDDAESINWGAPLPFEGPEPGLLQEVDGDRSFHFDIDAIETYCRHFGVEALPEMAGADWTLLSRTEIPRPPADKKPWWRFW